MVTYLDGNVLGGALGELFSMEMTSSMAQCASCGTMGPIGEVRVYPDGPGMVARCATCDEIVLRLVRGPDRAWLDMRGISCLQLALPEDV